MSAFSGPQGKGAARARRDVKRAQAETRQAQREKHHLFHFPYGPGEAKRYPWCERCKRRNRGVAR